MRILSGFSCPVPTLRLIAPVLHGLGEATDAELLGMKRLKVQFFVLPTSHTFFTLILLGSTVPVQTPECSEYHRFAQSQVVSTLSRTEFPQHGASSQLPSGTRPLLVPSDLP